MPGQSETVSSTTRARAFECKQIYARSSRAYTVQVLFDHKMSSDIFDELLGLEDNFYKEGYEAGLADGAYAGHVEGKLFGIEKGYEKALELGKLHGRAVVWQIRQQHNESRSSQSMSAINDQPESLSEHLKDSSLPKNSRMTKHIGALLSAVSEQDLAMDNSDLAVTQFDERISRAQAKAKVIAAIAGENIQSENAMDLGRGIEESLGLNARH